MFVSSDMTPVSGPRLDAFRFPAGDALLVVGDIHGQLDGMRGILKGIGEWGTPGKRRHLVFTGDFIDRGPASIECLMLALSPEAAHLADADVVTLLPGNHELMFADAIDDAVNRTKTKRATDNINRWMMNGGCAVVLEAYAMSETPVPTAYVDAVDALRKDLACCGPYIDQALKRWPAALEMSEAIRLMNAVLLDLGLDMSKIIRGWDTHFRMGDALCVHAGIYPKNPLEYTFGMAAEDHCNFDAANHDHHWAWIRDPFLVAQSGFTEDGERFAEKDTPGLLVFHGHTPAPKAALHRLDDDARVAEVFSRMATNARVCVDGGAARGCGVAGAILTDAGLANCFHPN